MIGNLIEASITTVTAGSPDTFTLSDVAGAPNLNDVFGGSGTRYVEYCAIQFTDSTRAEMSKAQWGIGVIDLSTMVLTQQTILGTWDAGGPTYDDTSPAELTFTAGATTTRLYCAPQAAHGGAWCLPYVGTDLGDNIGALPANQGLLTGTTPSNTLTLDTVYYLPMVLNFMFPISQATVRITTNRLSATTSQLEVAIYEIKSDGKPGKQLAYGINTGNNCLATNAVNVTVTFNAPVFLPPGMYYVALRGSYTGGSQTPAINALTYIGGSPLGASFGSAQAKSIPGATVSTTITDPATTAGWALIQDYKQHMVAFK